MKTALYSSKSKAFGHNVDQRYVHTLYYLFFFYLLVSPCSILSEKKNEIELPPTLILLLTLNFIFFYYDQ